MQLEQGLMQVGCSVDMTSLTDFLKHIQKVATFPDSDIQWLRGLAENSRNHGMTAGLVPKFKGQVELFQINFQLSPTGTVEIYFVADTDFAAALLDELGTSCNAN